MNTFSEPLGRLIRWGLYFLLFSTPLIFLPFTDDALLIGKSFWVITWAFLLLIMISAAGIIRSLNISRPKPTYAMAEYIFTRPFAVPVLLFMLITLLSCTWAEVPLYSLSVWLLYGAFMVVFFLISNHIKDRKQAEILIISIILAGLLSAIYGIIQYFQIDPIPWVKSGIKGKTAASEMERRMTSLLGNTNYLAGYLVPCMWLSAGMAVFSWRSRPRLIFYLASFIILLITVLMTGTRSAYIGTLVGLMLFAILTSKNPQRKVSGKQKLLILLIVFVMHLVFIGGIKMLPDSGPAGVFKSRFEQIFKPERNLANPRIFLWQLGSKIIRDHPIGGLGVGQFGNSYLNYFFDAAEDPEFAALNARAERLKGAIATYAHNDYLQFWMEGGFFTLLAFLFIVTLVIYRLFKRWSIGKDRLERACNIGIGIALITILTDAFFSFPLQLPANGLLFWALLGLYSGYSEWFYADEVEKVVPVRADKRLWRRATVYALTIVIASAAVTLTFRNYVSSYYCYKGGRDWNRFRSGTGDPAILQSSADNLAEAIKWNRLNGLAALRIAFIYELHNDHVNTVLYLLQAMKTYNQTTIYSKMGEAYFKAENLTRAEEYFSKTLTIDPDNPAVLYNRGLTYLGLGETDKALADFKKAKWRDPQHFNAWFHCGDIFKYQGRYDDALNCFKKAVEIKPDATDILIQIGDIYKDQKNNPQRAREYYERAGETARTDSQKRTIYFRLESLK